jgi:predicted HTH domain antitoxin
MTIEIPTDILRSMKLPEGERSERVTTELALRLYQTGVLTFGKARKLAGMTKWEFQSVLGKEGMLRRYDVEDLKKDLSTVEKLRDRSE